jgi:hypothetical protein
MSPSPRNAAPMLLAAAAAVAWGVATAPAAVADPGDPQPPSPAISDFTGRPLPISTIDRLWNLFIPPNPIVPQSPVATFGSYIPQFFPILR